MKRAVPQDRRGDWFDTARGLLASEYEIQLRQYGTNQIVETPANGWLPLLLNTLKDPMLWFLLGMSLLFWIVGETTEAWVLLAALLPFLGMDAFLHRRTQVSTAGLSSRLASEAKVLRDGEWKSVNALDLVPGDFVEVKAGEPFPADGLLISAEAVQIDESSLTGEAYPVHKSVAPSLDAGGAPEIEDVHWGFAGTRILTGTVRMRVIYTGQETLYGEIVKSAVQGSKERTPLQVAVFRLVRSLLLVALGFCLLLAGIRLYQGHGLLDAAVSALTLAVAALPEEFPVVLTFFLGVGVYRLAKRRALVRRAVVVENIGRVTAICSDKTGTITAGQLRLAHLFPAEPVDEDQLKKIGVAASHRESFDAMDMAILEQAPPGFNPVTLARFPYTEDRRRETAIVRMDNSVMAVIKGAPEVVFNLCALDTAQRLNWSMQVEQLASQSHKVIACAWRPQQNEEETKDEPDKDFLFSGLLAFEDPIRDGVSQALHQCADAGIQVIMVTGDHPATAQAVAKEIGLGGGSPLVITGEEMDERLKTEGQAFLQQVHVIARARPSQKLTLVNALQAQGKIVAVTGDGVNDVPALQAADVGIAMGERGTRSAREIASIILMDDNFRTIVDAIAEGRQLFTNLQLSFQFLLLIHVPLVFTAALIPMFGYPILYLPIHIVWLEMIIHPTAMLVFQALPEQRSLRRIGRPRSGISFFDTTQRWQIILIGAFVTVAVCWSYIRSLGIGRNVEHARAMALATLILVCAAITMVLSRLRGKAAKLVSLLTLLSAVLLIQIPLFAPLLHLHPLHWDDWLIALCAALLVSVMLYVRTTPLPSLKKILKISQ